MEKSVVRNSVLPGFRFEIIPRRTKTSFKAKVVAPDGFGRSALVRLGPLLLCSPIFLAAVIPLFLRYHGLHPH